jgi:hypothetical protein
MRCQPSVKEEQDSLYSIANALKTLDITQKMTPKVNVLKSIPMSDIKNKKTKGPIFTIPKKVARKPTPSLIELIKQKQAMSRNPDKPVITSSLTTFTRTPTEFNKLKLKLTNNNVLKVLKENVKKAKAKASQSPSIEYLNTDRSRQSGRVTLINID